MPNGRKLFPVMPWPQYAHLSSQSAQRHCAAYLKSLPPIKHIGAFRAQRGPVDAGLRDRAGRRLRQDAGAEVNSRARSAIGRRWGPERNCAFRGEDMRRRSVTSLVSESVDAVRQRDGRPARS